MCKRTCCLVPLYFILLSSTLLFACEKPDNKSKPVSPLTNETSRQNDATKATALNTEAFAPTVETDRRGIWLGGPPPMNKGASGVITYYRIKATDKPNHLTMTLRFEGIEADDAKVEFRPIDDAVFAQKDQRFQWRLKPDIVSEITFSLIVPDETSYITVNTYQYNQGSARAFILETR